MSFVADRSLDLVCGDATLTCNLHRVARRGRGEDALDVTKTAEWNRSAHERWRRQVGNSGGCVSGAVRQRAPAAIAKVSPRRFKMVYSGRFGLVTNSHDSYVALTKKCLLAFSGVYSRKL